ncbi:IS21 family transposase [Catellatospora methionotrophica]
MVDITEILTHWYAGRSINEMSFSLGVDRKTIRKYLAPALDAGMRPGGGPIASAEWARLVGGWFPHLSDTRLRQVTWPEIDRHADYIKVQLAAGVTQSTVWQRLCDEHGLATSLTSFRRWVVGNVPEEARRGMVTVLRDDVPAGEEAQIDYGLLGSWTDPVGGKRRKVWAFVMVLACSRHMFVQPTLVMDQAAWTQAHVDAFAFFGGVPRRLIPDNLRTGVTRADLYDPKINRSYAELAEHYGVLIDPGRAAKPKDKPRVERQVPYVRDSFWRGREFTSLEQMREQARAWCLQVAGARACRPLGGDRPLEVFTAVEAPALGGLPRRPFVLATWSTAAVGPDIHARVGKTLYSIPWRFIGERVDARATATVVQFFHHGQLIATHGHKTQGKQTDMSHYPPEKIAFKMRTPTWCRTRSVEIGAACAQVIDTMLEVGVLFRLRAAQGVLGLADKYPPQRVEAACARAIAVGDPSYRTVKGILAAGTDIEPVPQRGRGDGGAAAFLHGPTQLFANVIPLPTAVAPTAADPSTTVGDHTVHGDSEQVA